MNRTCPSCDELSPANASECETCGKKLVLFIESTPKTANAHRCTRCGKSLQGRHLLARFCSDTHRKQHWAERRYRTAVA